MAPAKTGAAPIAEATRTQPHWPGLGLQGEPGHPLSSQVIEPVKGKGRIGLWVSVALVMTLACGLTGMLGWELISRRIDRLRTSAPLVVSTSPTGSASQFHAASKTDPRTELQNKLVVAAAADAVEPLVARLFTGGSLDERLQAVANPEIHGPEVQSFFTSVTGHLTVVAIRSISNPPRHFASGARLPVFRVVTSQSQSGALAWLVTNAQGNPVIHWPLFRETHEGALAAFIQAGTPDPRWFHVGLRRAHSFELPESERENYHVMEVDASTDGSAHVVVFAARESPVGRLLDRRLEWGAFYLGRLLLSWMDIAGEKRIAVLDAGAPD